MQVQFYPDHQSLSLQARELIVKELVKKPDLLLCTATGSSPTLTYQYLAETYTMQRQLFQSLRIIKLDEWGGVSMTNPQSCEAYLKQHVLSPLQISEDRYIGFDSKATDPQNECYKVNSYLADVGGIDLCILGLGMNGHIAFNEPAPALQPYAHIAKLSDQSMQHPMSLTMGEPITHGLTLGMANILQSKLILMLINGHAKHEIAKKFLTGQISTYLPASFLWLHPNTICLVAEDTKIREKE